MYAIIRQGGKQYRVAAGDEIVCDKVKGNQGEEVRVDKILLVSDADKTIVVPEELAKYDIKAELVENFADNKVLVFKYRAKKGYRQMNGHRQQKSRIRIVSIGPAKAPAKTTAKTRAMAAKTEEKPKKTAAKIEEKPKKTAGKATKPKKTEAAG